MKILASQSAEGAYGFSSSVAVGVSRRGYYYAIIAGFAWAGNQGAPRTIRHRISPKIAEAILDEIKAQNAGDTSPWFGRPCGGVTDLQMIAELSILGAID
jgi:hypothetical protein